MIRGTVQSVLFQNPENGYSVLKLRTEEGELVTVVGTIPMTIVGERLVIAGRWGHHPNHGQQFEAEFLERLMPETKAEIFSFLSSRAVKGIGAKTAQRLILDLKDKVDLEEVMMASFGGGKEAASDTGTGASVAGMAASAKEAVAALTALGYTNMEASKAVKKVEITENMSVEDILKASLKYLSFL